MGSNAGRTDGDEESSGSQSKQGQKHCEQRYVYVFDFKYFFFAAHSNQYHCLSESVWKCKSGRDCRGGDCGDAGQYGSRSSICNGDEEKEARVGKRFCHPGVFLKYQNIF